MPWVASAAHWSAFALIFATAQLHANRRAPAARSSTPAWTSVTSNRIRTAPWLTNEIVQAGSDSSSHPHRKGGRRSGSFVPEVVLQPDELEHRAGGRPPGSETRQPVRTGPAGVDEPVQDLHAGAGQEGDLREVELEGERAGPRGAAQGRPEALGRGDVHGPAHGDPDRRAL